MQLKNVMVGVGLLGLVCLLFMTTLSTDSSTDGAPNSVPVQANKEEWRQQSSTLATQSHGLEPKAALPVLTEQLGNPLQTTHDLRSLYERFRGSDNPRERSIAYRAWSTCFPAFMAAEGGMAPLDRVLSGLAQHDQASGNRADALREIWGRCKQFSNLSRDQLLVETQAQQDTWMRGSAHSPGEAAAKLYMAGNTDEALRLAREAAATQDPYAIDSLKDFVIHYWWDLNDRQPERKVDHPDLRALSFLVVACNMGLECGPSSLIALQQCSSTGACTGNAVDRYLQGLPTASDRDFVMNESRRVEKAIRAKDYQALGLQ